MVCLLGVLGLGDYLEAEDFGLGEGKGFAVYFHESFAGLGEGIVSCAVVLRFWGRCGWAVYLAMCDCGCCERFVSECLRVEVKLASLPVFFLPKHCTLCVVAMIADGCCRDDLALDSDRGVANS